MQTTTTITDIPLSKLVASAANVRKTHVNASIDELAASIEHHGLLQNLTVRPTKSKKKEYEVIAGGRRLAALKLLAKRKSLAADAPVACHVIEDGNSTEISLAENVGQEPMHPADQYEAFAKLHNEDGMSADDIGARFGVTATVVKQRLKLGAVSPKLMALYREGDLNLEQLSAFTITDDHDKQERVWNRLLGYNNDRHAILRALSSGQVSSEDRRAVFVGLDAYEQAGGVVVRDLFDTDGGGFLNDEGLLDRLARDKLAKLAEGVSGEGWKWVEADIVFDGSRTADMRRVYPVAVKLSAADKKRLKKLQVRHDALLDKHGDDLPEAAQVQYDRIEQAIAELQRYDYKPADIACAGAIVTLAHDGGVRTERGFVRAEDEPKKKAAKPEEAAGEAPQPKALSDKLVADLTAHRTAALRNELALAPSLALQATVHALAQATFYRGQAASCLNLSCNSALLASHAEGIDDTVAGKAIAERHAAWATHLPGDVADLWEFLQQFDDGELRDLLAHCVSLTVDAVQLPHRRNDAALAHAGVLAQNLPLDMRKYWQPTAASYFGRVSKERIMEAMREAVSPEAASTIATLKKQAMADCAEQRMAGTGWLPEVLRT